ncbi:LysR family transcriptional regulator [Blastococcus sp. SYSU D00820]
MTETGGRSFDLNTLAALDALLRERNLTYAGATIGLAQPAMSTLLGRFRRHFGDELLVRTGRDYQLTPRARELLPQVGTALRLLRETLGVESLFDPAEDQRVFRIAASDYAATVLHGPLYRRLRERAPRAGLVFTDIGEEPLQTLEDLLRNDLVVAPLGFGVPGQHRYLFRDRLVCVLDRDNPRLRDGRLDLAAFRALPYAGPQWGGTSAAVTDRVLDEAGADRRSMAATQGFLPLSFLVEGTDAVTVLPERLARLLASGGRLLVLDPPFAVADMFEAMYWHPTRADDPAHGWLRGLLAEVADELAAEATPGPVTGPAGD